MGELTENAIFVKFTLFYLAFISLIILIPFDFEAADNTQDIIDSDTPYLGRLVSTVDNFFIDLTGLPPIINDIIFAPLAIISIYLIVRLLVYVLPFVGD